LERLALTPAVVARRDIGLNVRELLPPLPQRQVELHLSACLLLAWGIEHLDLELMRVNMGRGAADPLQEALQVEEKPWVTDEDVQGRWRHPGVAAAGHRSRSIALRHGTVITRSV
jgi:hypothetical protein